MIEKYQKMDKLVSGGAMPGSMGDIVQLKHEGVKLIVSLEEMPESREMDAKNSGIKVVRIPLDDAAAPTKQEVHKFLRTVNANTRKGNKVYVHCQHGIGRAREMLAFYLISKGFRPLQAHGMVGGVQTQRQKKFLLEYGEKIYEKGQKLRERVKALKQKPLTRRPKRRRK